MAIPYKLYMTPSTFDAPLLKSRIIYNQDAKIVCIKKMAIKYGWYKKNRFSMNYPEILTNNLFRIQF